MKKTTRNEQNITAASKAEHSYKELFMEDSVSLQNTGPYP